MVWVCGVFGVAGDVAGVVAGVVAGLWHLDSSNMQTCQGRAA